MKSAVVCRLSVCHLPCADTEPTLIRVEAGPPLQKAPADSAVLGSLQAVLEMGGCRPNFEDVTSVKLMIFAFPCMLGERYVS